MENRSLLRDPQIRLQFYNIASDIEQAQRMTVNLFQNRHEIVAIGQCKKNGEDALLITVMHPRNLGLLPEALFGFPVVSHVSGEITGTSECKLY